MTPVTRVRTSATQPKCDARKEEEKRREKKSEKALLVDFVTPEEARRTLDKRSLLKLLKERHEEVLRLVRHSLLDLTNRRESVGTVEDPVGEVDTLSSPEKLSTTRRRDERERRTVLTAEAAAETIPEPREEGEAGGRWTSSCGFPPTRGAGADIVAVVVVAAVEGKGEEKEEEGKKGEKRTVTRSPIPTLAFPRSFPERERGRE